MTQKNLQNLLARFADLSILVLGDFFLDRYLIIDPDLAEISLETGLEARQVVEIRNSPGAAGTVTSNLCALDVGSVRALGVIGADGQGYDLKAGLAASGVDIGALIEVPDRFTPTYTKPLVKPSGREMERLDIKNRAPLPANLEVRVIDALHDLLPHVHGIIALDQVQERNCGVITDGVRDELAQLSRDHPGTVVFADSRTRIHEFRNVILKPNSLEAVQAVCPDHAGEIDRHLLESCARAFSGRTNRPVFITLGPGGILCAQGADLCRIPGIRVTEPIDIVGAGDSVSASVTSALCAGASPAQAALLGVLTSSITIQQLGATGTASPQQILRRFSETYPDGWAEPAQG